MLLPKQRHQNGSTIQSRRSRPSPFAHHRFFRPQIERLEDRLVLNYSFSSTPIQWVELHGDPTATTVINAADDAAASINLGSNTINFYGTTYTGATALWASSNGLITFGTGNSAFLNGNLLSSPSQAAISPFWEDLVKTAANASISGPMLLSKIDTANNRVIIEWNQVNDFLSSNRVTFEAIIQLNTGSNPGNITFDYLQLDFFKGSHSSVGIKAAGDQGPNSLVVSYNLINPLVDNNKAILFTWQSPVQIPAIGSLGTTSAAEGSPNLTLTVNGSNFANTSFIQFGGTALTTSFINTTLLQATIPASLLAEEGNFNITVVTPGSSGGTSNAVPFNVSDASLTPSGQLLSGTEGQALTNALVATFTDPGSNGTTTDYSATVTWDDGSGQSHTSTGRVQLVSGTTFAVYADNTVAYSEEGMHGVTVAINDVGGSQITVTSEVSVADAALTASGMNISSMEGVSFSGQVASFSDTDPGALLGDFSATINWGDGQTSTGTITTGAGGSFVVSGGHTYAEDGNFAVSVNIMDVGGASVAAPTTASVGDAALAAQGASIVATEGATYSGVVATFTDANLNAPASDFSAVITWGDGQSSTGLVTANGGGQFTVTGANTYAEEGNFAIGVTITDQGGSSAPATGAASVADALLSASGMTVNPLEGNSYTGVVASFTDADPNGTATDYQATINWGDGTVSAGTVQANPLGGFSVVGSHAFAEEGTTTITVTIQDMGGSQRMTTAISTAVTGDAPLTATGLIATATEGTAFSGTVATFTDADTFATTADYVVTVDWGDGSTSSATVVVNPSGGFLVTGTHTYAEEGTASINVNILDDGKSAASVTSTMNIGDANLSAIGTTVNAVEGAAFNGTVATFSDANLPSTVGDFSAAINWGDGITTPGTISSNGSGGFVVSGAHTYAEDGNYSMSVTISDVGGAGATASSSAQVGDASLTATGSPVSTVEGSVFSGTVATFTDANPNATASDFTALITWGDGHSSNGVISPISTGGFAVNGVNTFAEEGNYAITMQIMDAGGAGASTKTSATVADAPVQAMGTAINAAEGSSFAGTVATFTDSYAAGPATDFSATISWGDGSSTTGSIIPLGNGQYAIRGSHVYAEDGPYSVSVQITDAGGTLPAVITSASVSDAALAATIGSISTMEGASFSGPVASFQDANPTGDLADYSATISWGDGTTSAGTVSVNPTGGFQVSGSHTYSLEGALGFTVTITDNGGASASVNGTATVADAPLSANGTSLTEIQGIGFTTVLATFTDGNLLSSPGDFTAVVSWGDGSSSAGTVNQNGPGSFSVLGNHTYALAGSFTVKIQITDAGGETAAANGLANVIPVITDSGATIHATEGVSFTAVVANFSDANSNLNAGNFTAAITWADGTSSAGVISANSTGGYSVTGTHTYGIVGTESIRVDIRDGAGGSAQAISTVIVADSIPVVQAHVHHHEHQHQVFLTGAFFDSALEGHTVLVNWGDGTTSVVNLGVSQTGPFSLGHEYSGHFLAEQGHKVHITVTVIDDAGTSSAPLVLNLSFDHGHHESSEGDDGHHEGEGNIWDVPGLNLFS